MAKKVTWEAVRNDFKQHFPNLNKSVVHWQPYGYATVLLCLNDGMKVVYDYDNKTAKFTN